MNCIHGIDERFCAACNRTATSGSGGTVGRTTLSDVLTFLNDEQVRATYSAVGEAIGVTARALSVRLDPRRPEASWVVNPENGLPPGYDQTEWHPSLLNRGEVIKSGRELVLRMTIRQGKARRN